MGKHYVFRVGKVAFEIVYFNREGRRYNPFFPTLCVFAGKKRFVLVK
jgi:hypothetical protein